MSNQDDRQARPKGHTRKRGRGTVLTAGLAVAGLALMACGSTASHPSGHASTHTAPAKSATPSATTGSHGISEVTQTQGGSLTHYYASVTVPPGTPVADGLRAACTSGQDWLIQQLTKYGEAGGQPVVLHSGTADIGKGSNMLILGRGDFSMLSSTTGVCGVLPLHHDPTAVVIWQAQQAQS